jgi:hypothetical protein
MPFDIHRRFLRQTQDARILLEPFVLNGETKPFVVKLEPFVVSLSNHNGSSKRMVA